MIEFVVSSGLAVQTFDFGLSHFATCRCDKLLGQW